MAYKDPARKREYNRKYRREHQAEINEYGRKYYAKDTEKWREYKRLRSRESNRRQRGKVIEEMGGKCVKCGFDDWRALQIDHIEGGGWKSRPGGTHSFYKQILENEDWRKKLQLLCANCNWIKKYERRENGRRTGKRLVDWYKISKEYIEGNMTLRSLARKYKVSVSATNAESSKGKWSRRRRESRLSGRRGSSGSLPKSKRMTLEEVERLEEEELRGDK